MDAVRRAVIDIGANSAKLLVVDLIKDRLEVVTDTSEACRLGEAVLSTGDLSEAARRRTDAALESLLWQARLCEPQEIRIYGTSPFRIARNAAEYARHVERKFRVPIQILSSTDESAAIFRGVGSESALRGARLLVLDLGGGSVECVIGRGNTIHARTARDIGCVWMTETFMRSQPVRPDDRKALVTHVRRELESALADLSAPDRTLVLTGGTACAVAALAHGHLWKQVGGGLCPITPAALKRAVNQLCKLTSEELFAHRLIPVKRAGVIVAGALTLLEAVQMAGAGDVVVSARGLRFGLAASPP